MLPQNTTQLALFTLCACGCGQVPKIRYGRPNRFMAGHHQHLIIHRTIIVRFWEKVDKQEQCWVWLASKTADGYGEFYSSLERKVVKAHRMNWILHFGQIPNGLQVLHHCDNPPCVNPGHLFLGTPADNDRDKISKNRAWWQTSPRPQDGERNNAAKLTADQVTAIRSLRRNTRLRQKDVAAMFGVSRSAISYIESGKLWANV